MGRMIAGVQQGEVGAAARIDHKITSQRDVFGPDALDVATPFGQHFSRPLEGQFGVGQGLAQDRIHRINQKTVLALPSQKRHARNHHDGGTRLTAADRLDKVNPGSPGVD